MEERYKFHFETKPLILASPMISFQVNKVRKKHANASPGDVEVFA